MSEKHSLGLVELPERTVEHDFAILEHLNWRRYLLVPFLFSI